MLGERGEKFRRSLLIGLAFCAMIVWALLFVAVWVNRTDETAVHFLVENWRVVFGLPFSSMGAFIVVALFRQSDAPLEFQGLGFKFQGSAGEVVLWIVCFLALVASIRILAGEPVPVQADLPAEAFSQPVG